MGGVLRRAWWLIDMFVNIAKFSMELDYEQQSIARKSENSQILPKQC